MKYVAIAREDYQKQIEFVLMSLPWRYLNCQGVKKVLLWSIRRLTLAPTGPVFMQKGNP